MIIWKDDVSNLDRYGIDAIQNGVIGIPACCENPVVHVYGHKHRANRGSVWVWCSNCGAFAHVDGVDLSEWWENSNGIDFEKLTAVPVYLESKKNVVDAHYSEFQKRFKDGRNH